MTEDDDIEVKPEYSADDLHKMGEKWLERIRLSEKREDQWRKNAEAAEKAYLADESHETTGELPDFNILHSNVETIVPSIYNSTPVPDIRPRHNNVDPVAKVVSELLERAISVQIDDNRMDSEIERQAQDAFVAGRGVVRVKFDADVSEQPQMDDAGNLVMAQVVSNERIEFEVVSWNDYRQGPAKRWKDVPWVSYLHHLSDDDREAIENPDMVALQGKDDKSEVEQDKEADTPVWEIWCKKTGRVYFITDDTNKVLNIHDDPLGLKGFFPQGEPVQPISATNSLIPVCPYTIYKKLAQELDKTTRRINKITDGLKVRGLFAGSAEAVEELANADDNQLVTVADIENLVATGGLDKAIMWWPLETAIAVLQQLYAQREQTKQAIYEITGISDIIRGQSSSQETATAQQIKTQWGSMRIKKMQRLLERQVRDIFVICSDIISMHFSADTLQRMTGVQIPPEAGEFIQKPLDHYRVNIESDSTVRADLTRGRQEMSEFLNGTASFFSTMAPIVQQAPQAAGELIEIYSSFARQFNLGKQAEDALERLGEVAKQAATQPQPNPEAEAAQADAELKQQEMQLKVQEMQARMQADQQKAELEAQKAGLDVQIKQADLQLKNRELGIRETQLELEERKAEFEATAKAVEIDMEGDQERPVRFGDE